MTGFSGRIMLEGDPDTARSHLGTAMKLADKLNVWKQTQGISAVTKAYDLGDGSYCVVVDLSHMRAMQIVAPTPVEREYEPFEQMLTSYDYTGVADVVSGKVTFPTIIPAKAEVIGADGKPRLVDITALRGFTPTTKTIGRYTDIERRYRLNLPESPIFAPVSAGMLEITYSQHAHVKPSCYTGAMRKLAQFILGMGQVTRPTWEERWIKENKKGYLPVKQKDIASGKSSEVFSAFNLYYKKDVVSILNTYDYRFAKTHGVSFDPDGKPYLIEVSTRGVHAMPLYMDPVSLTVQGKKRYLDVSPELVHVFDTFGGIPLGINFPFTSKENTFDKWKRAGEIIELLSSDDMQEFYGKIPFTSAIGWAFDEEGVEAHNTCYDYQPNGVQSSYHYILRFEIDVPSPLLELSGARAALAAKFTTLYELNKCRRMKEEEAASILSKFEKDVDEGKKAFDELEVEPNVRASATLILAKSGTLWHPARNPKALPQIKFPEPMVGGLISVDMRALDYDGPPLTCDAPLFVCVIDGGVDIVNYSYDPRPRQPFAVENTRQKCQYTGGWTVTTPAGTPYVAGHFYSNRWDWRKEIVPSESVTTYKGKKIGVQGYADAPIFSMCVFVSSATIFKVDFKTESRTNQTLSISVAVPFYNRNCYYMTKRETVAREIVVTGTMYEAASGPEIEQWELYNFVFHWTDSCKVPPEARDGKSTRCIARKYHTNQVPSCVTDKIPGGFSYSVCPERVFANTKITVSSPYSKNAIIGGATWGDNIPFGSSTTQRDGPRSSCAVYMIADSGLGQIVTIERTIDDTPDGLPLSGWWWMFSPDPDSGITPWMSSTQSCLGDVVLNYDLEIDALTSESAGEPTYMYGGSTICYTGVIE